MPVNEYGQMIGEPIDDTPGVLPSLVRIEGQYAIIEALSVEKACGGFVSCLWPRITSRDVDLSLSTTSRESRRINRSFEADA